MRYLTYVQIQTIINTKTAYQPSHTVPYCLASIGLAGRYGSVTRFNTPILIYRNESVI